MSRARVLLQPRWLLLHAITVALIVAMVLLGRWQLTVSEHRHFSLQNFGYAMQWWLFSLFTAWMWVRVVRDALRRGDPAFPSAESPQSTLPPVQYRRYVMPQSSTAGSADDPERAAYNDYLARLAAEANGRSSEGTG